MSTGPLHTIDAYDFALPPERIAASPSAERSDARMLVLSPQGAIRDGRVRELPELLGADDLLVVNDVGVSPASLQMQRPSGGRVEVLVVGFGEEGDWRDPTRDVIALFRSNRRVVEGEALVSACSGFVLTLLERLDSHGMGRFRCEGGDAHALLAQEGSVPLPPYIRRRRRELGQPELQPEDSERYQTVYASTMGAVAAPTAGLHLDPPLLERIRERGVRQATIRLEVGIGTFRPVEASDLSEHRMHSERFVIPESTCEAIARTRERGGRVVAVGTTVVRALESAVREDGSIAPTEARTDLFIRPGFPFRVVDALMTNFHLPRSTLLALVCAFAGHVPVMRAYRHAVEDGYRFFSYGDAMFLQRERAQ